ncbi:MAG TPA: sugar phosphate isomerase/epimerase [Anaerolineae bacterium]|jgi:sugar phosphate isomerase/epimerase|nr:sugar phosphate isomerase/epimerase [Anaerolineae bacterium]
MAIKGFGINADASRLDGDLDLLRRDLRFFEEVGFEYVEIPVHGVDAIRNGQLVTRRVQEVNQLLKRFPFCYTVHAPNPLNLMNLEELNMHKKMLLSSIQFAYAIGSETLVYHCGRYVAEEEFLLPNQPRAITYEMMDTLKQVELEILQELADYAAGLGINICIENARPYLDGSPYCYGEFLDQLVEQVKRINKSNVGINLDLGHAYLASQFYCFDFVDAIESVGPLVRHMHVHDNFGKLNSSFEREQPEMVAAGRGDCHMPIGWGYIPFKKAIAALRNYSGVFMLELRPRYMQYCDEALAQAKELALQAGWIEYPIEDRIKV